MSDAPIIFEYKQNGNEVVARWCDDLKRVDLLVKPKVGDETRLTVNPHTAWAIAADVHAGSGCQIFGELAQRRLAGSWVYLDSTQPTTDNNLHIEALPPAVFNEIVGIGKQRWPRPTGGVG